MGDRPAVGSTAPAPTGDIGLVYVSPLKALSYDIDRNLRVPLRGIGAELKVAVRTGDTPQRERQAMLREPPDILITTPESLYLMLTGRAQELFAGAESCIVDEIHAVASTKRGAHLALTLERLTAAAGRDVQRIGLSATQKPLEEIGRFLVGPSRARAGSSTPGCARSSTWRSWSRSTRWSSRSRRRRRTSIRSSAAPRPPAARSGRRSTPSCSS